MQGYISRNPRLVNKIEILGFLKKGEELEKERKSFDFLIEMLNKGMTIEKSIEKTKKKYDLEIKLEKIDKTPDLPRNFIEIKVFVG